MRVFFLSQEWVALNRFVKGEVNFPEGMPSVYIPWLRYKEQGHDVHVFIIGDFKKINILNFQGCQIHIVPRIKYFQNRTCRFPIFTIKQFFDSLSLCKAVTSIARNKPPHVIYSYQEQTTYVGWLLAKYFRAVFIKRFFGTWAYKNWYQQKNIKSKIYAVTDFIKWLWPSDLLIVTNDGTYGDKIAKLLGIGEEKFRFWLNGVSKDWKPDIETSVKLRKSLGFSEEHLVLMCLSRLADWKRQDRVIRAMPMILKDVPHARLVLAGDGPQRKYLEELVKELELCKYVLFTGMIEHNKVHDMMGVADIFLQTNDISCLGNTLLEAIICGRTVVTWDVGATGDIVIDGQNGRLMPNAEPATIANTVIELAKDPVLMHRLASGARKFAVDHLQSWDERMEMEIKLVAEICTKRFGCIS
jgi:glycosyltransferase involved in cell wall biosynthesis